MRLPLLQRPRRVVWLAIGMLLLAAYGLVQPGAAQAQPPDPLVPSVLSPDSRGAELIAQLFTFILYLAVGIFVLVEALIIYSVVKFRRREGDGEPVQVYGNTQLEIAWTVIPALLVASILVLSLQVMPEIANVPGESVATAEELGVCYVGNLTTDQAVAAAGSDLLVVKVTGRQWFWEFEYPQYGFKTATQLVAPAGRVVKLDLTAADVIHAWWIPELGPQFNVTPGYNMTSWFNAEKPRTYEGQCSMFCGDAHPYMPMQVVALPSAQFDQWAEAQRLPRNEPNTALATQGEALFASRGCVACHAIGGYPENKAVAQIGPNLTHFGSRTRVAAFLENTPQNLSRWLRNPQEVKPGAKMPNLNLKPDEIAALVAYLENLK